MAKRQQVLDLLSAGCGYQEIGERLRIAPGLAYLLATGLSADGSDAPTAHPEQRPGFLPTSQHLANPQPADNPTSRALVRNWIQQRVAADPQMRAAFQARQRQEES